MENLHSARSIYRYIVVVLIFILLLCFFLSENEIKVKEINLHEVECLLDSENIVYYIDKVELSQNRIGKKSRIEIQGWCVLVGKNADMISMHVVISDLSTGVSYELPTTIETRTDVTEHFSDGFVYDNSGFYANTTTTKINIEDDYSITLLYKNGDELFKIDTEASFKEGK